MPMADAELENFDSQEIWVNTNEAAEITGYNNDYIRKLCRDNWSLSENERVIRLRRRVERYEMWLPDLLKYKEEVGFGPYLKK
jgi:hypothetical protein